MPATVASTSSPSPTTTPSPPGPSWVTCPLMRLWSFPSLELTSYYGHAVILNPDRWVDWRMGLQRLDDQRRGVGRARRRRPVHHRPPLQPPHSDLHRLPLGLRRHGHVARGRHGSVEQRLATRGESNLRNLTLWREQATAQKQRHHGRGGDGLPQSARTGAPRARSPMSTPRSCPSRPSCSASQAGRVVLSTGPRLEPSRRA